MICGNCKDRDVTVAHVRDCFGAPKPVQEAAVNRFRPSDPNPLWEGRYAVEMDGKLRFFHVSKPAEGKWAGFTFVKEQASDDLYRVRGERAATAIRTLSEDPQAAMIRYGMELGKCGVCGRTLTDEESRANGIGPICAEKFGS